QCVGACNMARRMRADIDPCRQIIDGYRLGRAAALWRQACSHNSIRHPTNAWNVATAEQPSRAPRASASQSAGERAALRYLSDAAATYLGRRKICHTQPIRRKEDRQGLASKKTLALGYKADGR